MDGVRFKHDKTATIHSPDSKRAKGLSASSARERARALSFAVP